MLYFVSIIRALLEGELGVLFQLKKRQVSSSPSQLPKAASSPSKLAQAEENQASQPHTLVTIAVTSSHDLIMITERNDTGGFYFTPAYGQFELPRGRIPKNDQPIRERAAEILRQQAGVATTSASWKILGALKNSFDEVSDCHFAVYLPEIDSDYIERAKAENQDKGLTTVSSAISASINPAMRKWMQLALDDREAIIAVQERRRKKAVG